ncbi:hypothetical protein J2X20_002526 [Pelomonas saccharophila]|uniref:Uncharacterized protein n=2 Tax=Roseateles saccharophilus TaxID=304 RepID=A0ABU1YLY6_ROSSA|nr:hypothetical protein [Roseateles saccharophilus]
MFLSLPQYEFPMPEGLAEPGSKHWRAMEMTLHVPWFLLTLEHVDLEGRDLATNYTLCIAWETDLADVIKTIGASHVRGLVAMMPAWASPTGQWSSRQITEVWLRTDDQGTSVTLTDCAGKQFDAGIRGAPPKAGCAGDLLLQLPSGNPRTRRKRSAATDKARRRAPPAR